MNCRRLFSRAVLAGCVVVLGACGERKTERAVETRRVEVTPAVVETSRAVAEAEARLAEGDARGALEVLTTALEETPGDRRLRAARIRVLEAAGWTNLVAVARWDDEQPQPPAVPGGVVRALACGQGGSVHAGVADPVSVTRELERVAAWDAGGDTNALAAAAADGARAPVVREEAVRRLRLRRAGAGPGS
jgi:hypothetical protein